jgi:hypothetical protein
MLLTIWTIKGSIADEKNMKIYTLYEVQDKRESRQVMVINPGKPLKFSEQNNENTCNTSKLAPTLPNMDLQGVSFNVNHSLEGFGRILILLA